MGKKGRLSAGRVASKGLEAGLHQREVEAARTRALEEARRRAFALEGHEERLRREGAVRPRFGGSFRKSLARVLGERRAEESFDRRERRRRNGFLLPLEGPLPVRSGHLASQKGSPGVGVGMERPVHPEGWLLRYPSGPADAASAACADPALVQRLGDLSLAVLARCLREYRDAMGSGKLYGVLSVLPPECATDLSVLLSAPLPVAAPGARSDRAHQSLSSPRWDDDLVALVGQHPDADKLCFRNQPQPGRNRNRNAVTGAGLRALIPRPPAGMASGALGGRGGEEDDRGGPGCRDWDDDDECECDDDEHDDDYDQHPGFYTDHNGGDDGWDGLPNPRGCNLRLRRLELLDLNGDDHECECECECECDDCECECEHEHETTRTESVLARWFEKCSGITHLSLAGSFVQHPSTGRAVVLSLPKKLASLEVLDLTGCPWATDRLLERVVGGYRSSAAAGRGTESFEPPVVYSSRGRFVWEPGAGTSGRGPRDPWADG